MDINYNSSEYTRGMADAIKALKEIIAQRKTEDNPFDDPFNNPLDNEKGKQGSQGGQEDQRGSKGGQEGQESQGDSKGSQEGQGGQEGQGDSKGNQEGDKKLTNPEDVVDEVMGKSKNPGKQKKGQKGPQGQDATQGQDGPEGPKGPEGKEGHKDSEDKSDREDPYKGWGNVEIGKIVPTKAEIDDAEEKSSEAIENAIADAKGNPHQNPFLKEFFDRIRGCSETIKGLALNNEFNSGTADWISRVNKSINSFVTQKIHAKKNSARKRTFARMARRPAVSDSAFIVKGSKPNPNLISIGVSFYIDISGSMGFVPGRMENACAAAIAFSESIQEEFKAGIKVADEVFQYWAFNDEMFPSDYNSVRTGLRAGGDNMELSEMVRLMADHATKNQYGLNGNADINIIITDGEYGTGGDKLINLLNENKNMKFIFIACEPNREIFDISKQCPNLEYYQTDKAFNFGE